MYGENSRVYLITTLIDEIDWRDPRAQQRDAHKVVFCLNPFPYITMYEDQHSSRRDSPHISNSKFYNAAVSNF
jgi:hypothetical protein